MKKAASFHSEGGGLSLDELIIRKTTIGSDILEDIREKIKKTCFVNAKQVLASIKDIKANFAEVEADFAGDTIQKIKDFFPILIRKRIVRTKFFTQTIANRINTRRLQRHEVRNLIHSHACSKTQDIAFIHRRYLLTVTQHHLYMT